MEFEGQENEVLKAMDLFQEIRRGWRVLLTFRVIFSGNGPCWGHLYGEKNPETSPQTSRPPNIGIVDSQGFSRQHALLASYRISTCSLQFTSTHNSRAFRWQLRNFETKPTDNQTARML